jgi:hypothetical protein
VPYISSGRKYVYWIYNFKLIVLPLVPKNNNERDNSVTSGSNPDGKGTTHRKECREMVSLVGNTF